jgi:Reactive mitochondrial oxygen species modulator 1
MGAIVGGIFGGLTGLYYAITTRSFMYIPMIALTSGGSFGFFMGVGMVMRSEMLSRE